MRMNDYNVVDAVETRSGRIPNSTGQHMAAPKRENVNLVEPKAKCPNVLITLQSGNIIEKINVNTLHTYM